MQLNYFSINPIQKKMSMCKMKKKALALSLAMSVALPIGAFAQDGLFQRGVTNGSYYGYGGSNEKTEFLGHRNVQTSGIIDNQIFGQPVPLGSGIALLLVSGAGYVALKRKEDEK